MKTFKTLRALKPLIIIAAATFFTACDNNELPEATAQGEPLQISVSAEGFTGSGVQARASDTGYTTTFVAGDRIGITAITGGGSIVSGQDNIAFQYDGSGWNPVTSTDKIYAGAGSYIACYPYNAAMTGKATTADIFNAFTPQADQSTHDDGYTKSDLMTGTGAVSGATLNITLTHALAMLVVNLPSAAASPTFAINGSAVEPWNISGKIYRYLLKPAASVTVSGSYLNGATPYMFSQPVLPQQGKYSSLTVQ